jgi:hypothetical protein
MDLHTHLYLLKPEGKRPLGRPRLKWEDIKINLGDGGGANWIHLGQDMDQWRAFVNTVMNLCVQ